MLSSRQKIYFFFYEFVAAYSIYYFYFVIILFFYPRTAIVQRYLKKVQVLCLSLLCSQYC